MKKAVKLDFMNTKRIQVTASTEKAYGQSPGNSYHNLEVIITRKPNGRWTVDITDTLGTDLGFDEERIITRVVGRDATLEAAIQRATRLAMTAGMKPVVLGPTLEQANRQAREKSGECPFPTPANQNAVKH